VNKIILIDGSNLLHRSLHVEEVFQLSYNGIKTGGVHSFIRSLMATCRAFKDFPIVFWDRGYSERRINLYPNYKKREDKKQSQQAGIVPQGELEFLDEYRKQRAIINRILDAFGVPGVILENTEADDMINYFAVNHADKCSLIMSEDKDYIQLLDHVDLFRPMRKIYYTQNGNVSPSLINYSKIYNVKITNLEQMGFESTKQFIIAKSMQGDSSDNIPGVKGIGEVTAKKFSLEYVKNENWITELKAKPKLGAYEKKLLADLDGFNLAIDLIDLSREVISQDRLDDINNQCKCAIRKDPDLITLVGLFGEYGLNQIMGDLQEHHKIIMMAKPDVKTLFGV